MPQLLHTQGSRPKFVKHLLVLYIAVAVGSPLVDAAYSHLNAEQSVLRVSGQTSTAAVAHVSTGDIVGDILNDGVRRFAGIPYAAPPVEKRRFRKPEPAAEWQGTLDCTVARRERRAWPVQEQDASVGPFDISEDSLHLNVWAPPSSLSQNGSKIVGEPDNKAPVFFWIYGGGLVSGSKDYPGNEGSAYAQRGLVFVAPNYRVGALGFLQTRGGDSNVGLWDAVAALRWVKNEIGAFGGDASRVTIVGESAGADMAYWLSASPVANVLFQRVIMQSPSSFTTTPAQAAELADEFAQVSGARSSSLLDLQALDANQILRAQVNGSFRLAPTTGPGWRFMQQPVPKGGPGADLSPAGLFKIPARAVRPDNWPYPVAVVDGELLTDLPLDAFHAGVANHLSFIVGGNRDEDVWKSVSDSRPNVPDPQSYGTRVKDKEEVLRRIEWEIAGMPGLRGLSETEVQAKVGTIARAYEVERAERSVQQEDALASSLIGGMDTACRSALLEVTALANTTDAQWLEDRVATDFSFLGTVKLMADRLSKPGNADKIYRYQFQGYSNKRKATHGSELELMLGDGDKVHKDGAPEVRRKWLDSWAAFARTGDPNSESMGSKWREFREADRPIMLWDGVCGCSLVQNSSIISPEARQGLRATAGLWEDLWGLKS